MDEESVVEETSGNWYSDPDEDRISDDVFRHSTYRPNSNHNSVLECVNQILLRDMEEEESVLTAPRRFKHRGRIVRFQPARLSDIESVGSEMERKNSEECTMERGPINEPEVGNFEATASEDEFGMRIDQEQQQQQQKEEEQQQQSRLTIESLKNQTIAEIQSQVAIPIVVIEPKPETIEPEQRVSSSASCLEISSQRPRISSNRSTSPILRMERIEEKTCLQMSSKGLTIAKNLDYEDIESLPEIIPPIPKTPPALPPKPRQFRNTLILKKIPSPSFLIDETRKKHSQRNIDVETARQIGRGISNCILQQSKGVNGLSARSLVFEEKHHAGYKVNENGNNLQRFGSGKSSFQAFVNESLRESNQVIINHFYYFSLEF